MAMNSLINKYQRQTLFLEEATKNDADLPLLGVVCWFDLRTGASRAKLENALVSMKNEKAKAIIEANIPSFPKSEQSFAFAIANATTGLKDVQATKISQDDAKIIASILQREEQKNGNAVERVDFVQRARVALLLQDQNGIKLNTPIVVHEKQGDEVGQRIEQLYNWHRDNLTPNDIRPMVTKTFEASERLVLRRSGGMYFVPEVHLEIVVELFELLKELKCSGYFLPIFETTEALETLGECAVEDALDDVAALMQELESFSEQIAEGKGVRNSTIEGRLKTLDDLRSKSELYARILRHDVKQIEEKFAEAEQKLQALLRKQ